MKNKNVCIFCSSSNIIDNVYFNDAKKLSRFFAEDGYDLVYGGGMIGLMGEISRIFLSYKRKITSVIPIKLNKPGIVFENSTEIIETETINERKAVMGNISDSFITLAGGFGTLEEISEIISAKQLNFHNKAITILNTNGFYDNLIKHFEVIFRNNFSDDLFRNLYYYTDKPEDILYYINNYIPEKFSLKFT